MPIQLPLWADTIRPYQLKALQSILSVYDQGDTIAVMDAPTGTGKTLIGELLHQSLNCRTLYLCSSISLQEQFVRDFPHAALIRGRSNYTTADAPSLYPKLTAADCQKSRADLPACYDCDPSIEQLDTPHCTWCHPVTACPYEQAKAHAIRTPLVCTNTAYFLYEANYVGNIPLARDLIIVDEADLLEDTLLSFVEVSISKRRAIELGISAPERKTVESAWVEWAQYAEHHLKEIRRDGRFAGNTIAAIRARNSLDYLIRNIARLNDGDSGIASGGWVYTGYDKGDISFKPIKVSSYAPEYLWKHSPRWLLMSASTISFPVLMESLGL